jgi:hypothetical protein
MLSDQSSLRRLLFVCISLGFCLALAFRSVPGVQDPNDTGRYVVSQEDSCSSAGAADDTGAQQNVLNLLMRPACAIRSERLFLFVISAFLPGALALFGEWAGGGTLLLAAGLISSVVGFELATNALRQGVSLAFLIVAVSATWKPGRWLALGMALLLHTSSWIFLPWVLLLDQEQWVARKSKIFLFLLASVSVIAVWHYWDSIVAGLISDGLELLRTYEDIYSGGGTTAFLLFMLFPTVWVFAVRLIKTGHSLPRAEKLTFFTRPWSCSSPWSSSRSSPSGWR